MARNDKNSRTQNAKAFSDASSKGAPEGASPSPVLNRQQLISQVKAIIAKSISGSVYKTKDGEELEPTPNQKSIISAAEKNDVVFVDGPFGSGKTIWPTYMALKGLADKRYKNICITAPVVEAGEKLGFLPGEADDKMLPYINQLLEAFDDWIGKDLRQKLQQAGVINIEPQAYLRGRTKKDTFFILDESQNASGPQLMTAITRLGKGSTFVFMGDNRQNDRTDGDAAYVQFMNRFCKPIYMDSNYVGHAVLGKEDIRRHPFLKMMAENGDDRPLEQFETHAAKSGVKVTSAHKRNGANGSSGIALQPS